MLRAKSTAVIFVFTGWASMTAMAMEPDCATTEDDRCERWAVELPEALTHRSSFPVDVLLHPSETSVVAVGYARSESDPFQAGARGWVTSLDAETGAVLTHTVLEPASYVTIADAAMSPSGDRVVVAVASNGTGSEYDRDIATVAFAVRATGPHGRVVWQARYD